MRVDVDISELERFVTQLKQFNAELEQSTSKVEAQVRNLGLSWRDRQYTKFVEEWSATYRSISKYLEAAPEYVRHLAGTAARLRDVYR